MRIGIVSDSHGKAGRLRQAVALLIERGAEAVVHCGDVGSDECIGVLAEAGVPSYAVAGNMDRDRDQLLDRAAQSGVHFSLETILVPIGGGAYLAATHGNDAAVIGQLVAEGRFPYVCHGHTHLRRNERAGKVRIINPGALCHAHPPTVALLDTDADTVEHIEVG